MPGKKFFPGKIFSSMFVQEHKILTNFILLNIKLMRQHFIMVICILTCIISSCSSSDQVDAYGNFSAPEWLVCAETAGKIVSLSIEEGMILEPEIQVGSIDTTLLILQRNNLVSYSAGLKHIAKCSSVPWRGGNAAHSSAAHGQRSLKRQPAAKSAGAGTFPGMLRSACRSERPSGMAERSALV